MKRAAQVTRWIVAVTVFVVHNPAYRGFNLVRGYTPPEDEQKARRIHSIHRVCFVVCLSILGTVGNVATVISEGRF